MSIVMDHHIALQVDKKKKKANNVRGPKNTFVSKWRVKVKIDIDHKCNTTS